MMHAGVAIGQRAGQGSSRNMTAWPHRAGKPEPPDSNALLLAARFDRLAPLSSDGAGGIERYRFAFLVGNVVDAGPVNSTHIR